MSDTEKFYAAITTKMGGTRQWNQLHQMEQMQFIAALNSMLQICSQ